MHIRKGDLSIRRTPDEKSLTEGELRYLILISLAGLREDGRVPDQFRKQYESLDAVAPPWLTGLKLDFAAVARNILEEP